MTIPAQSGCLSLFKPQEQMAAGDTVSISAVAGWRERAVRGSFYKPYKCLTDVAASVFLTTSWPGGFSRGLPATQLTLPWQLTAHCLSSPQHPLWFPGAGVLPCLGFGSPPRPPSGDTSTPLSKAAGVSSKGKGRRREGRGQRSGHTQKILLSG